MAEKKWFAVRVKSNFEGITSRILRSKGYEEFLPTYRDRRIWSDRVKEIQAPLFPGYLFCQFDPQLRLPILTTPGVLNIVAFGRTLVPVAESEITAVRTMVESGLARRWPFLETGQRVRIQYGPLSGLEGILVEFRRGFRLVVSVPLLQRSVAAEIEGDWVRPLEIRRPATPELLPGVALHTA